MKSLALTKGLPAGGDLPGAPATKPAPANNIICETLRLVLHVVLLRVRHWNCLRAVCAGNFALFVIIGLFVRTNMQFTIITAARPYWTEA